MYQKLLKKNIVAQPTKDTSTHSATIPSIVKPMHHFSTIPVENPSKPLQRRQLRLARNLNKSDAPDSINQKQPIQRKVGFEFQTSSTNTVFIENETGKKFNDGKKEYYDSHGFTIEGDEGDLELVTKPFEETEAGFQEMASTFSWMEVFASQVEGKRFPITSLNQYFASAKPNKGALANKEGIDLNVEDKMLTDPQTTIGIKLDKLIDLAEILGSAPTRESAYLSTANKSPYEKEKFSDIRNGKGKERTSPVLGQDATTEKLAENIGWKSFEAKQYQGLVYDAKKHIDEEFGNFSQSLKGFLFLISMYSKADKAFFEYNRNKEFNSPANAKFAIPIISRTNLADLFLKLPPKDKEFFFDRHKYIAGRFGGDGLLFRQGLAWENYKSGFTIYEWLENILPGNLESNTPGLDFASVYESLGDISNRSFDERGNNDVLPPHSLNEIAFANINPKKATENGPNEFRTKKETARGRYGLGSKMQGPTDIGKATDGGKTRMDGLVIELRKLGAKLTPQEWWPFASDVFKLTVMLNQNKERRDQIIHSFINS